MKHNGLIASVVIMIGIALLVFAASAVDEAPKPATQPATAPATAPARVDYAPAREIATLANKRIKESSGLAVSRRRANVFWTHNDSGDRATIYAFGPDGRDLGMFVVTGASNGDWEDMASYSIGPDSFLILGDIGDNGSKRDSVTLYIVPEPEVNLNVVKGKPQTRATGPARKINFVYKDGPADCESLAVDVTTRTIFLVTKRPRQTVYTLPLDPPPLQPLGKGAQSNPAHGKVALSKVQVAQPIGSIKLWWPTAMDISPDGLRAVVLTYGAAYEYVRSPGETWTAAFARSPRPISVPMRKQGESICYGADGKTLYLTSEKLPTPLIEIPVAGGK